MRLKIGAALVLGVLALVLVLHVPFVRRAVLSSARAAVERNSGLRVDVGRLDYNLAALRVGLASLRLSAPGFESEPFFEAEYVSATLPFGALLGDIAFSRVARSNIWALLKLGAEVTLCGPSTLIPREFEKIGCRVTHDIDEAIAEADFINLLRIQHERQLRSAFPGIGEYVALFSLTKARLARTKPEAIIMHPGPINRGVEIDSEIADCSRSVILQQVTNGLAVRMAALYLVTGGTTDSRQES